MERMSDKLKDVCSEFYLSTEERCSVTAAIDRLAHYEDLAEQGRLVELPCKLGHTVYAITTPCGRCEAYNEPMCEDFIDRCLNCKHLTVEEMTFEVDLIEEFGKAVFLSRAEAEAALAASGREGEI